MILLGIEVVAVPKFISAQKLLADKFILEFSYKGKNNKKSRKIIVELNLGDIACFVKPHSDFVYDIIVRGILPKYYNSLQSPTVYVLIMITNLTFTI